MTTVPDISSIGNETTGLEDYWGGTEVVRWDLPDKKQWFEFRMMNEGERTLYQKKNKQSVAVDRSGNQTIDLDVAKERRALIETCLVGWNLFKNTPNGYEIVLFSKQNLASWLEVAPVKIVDALEFEIRMANPWLQQDMSLEDAYKQRDQIDRMIDQIKEKQMGESVSSNK